MSRATQVPFRLAEGVPHVGSSPAKAAGFGPGMLAVTWQVRGFTLHAWQADAVDCWCRGADGRPFRGTLEVFTGGGKSLIALAGAERVMQQVPATRVAIVVPTQALARQWRNVVLANTDLDPQQVGLLGAGSLDTLSNH